MKKCNIYIKKLLNEDLQTNVLPHLIEFWENTTKETKKQTNTLLSFFVAVENCKFHPLNVQTTPNQ